MPKRMMYSTELDKRLESWLKDQGIDSAMVSTEYSVERNNGMTMLNLKLYAPDFMENGAEAPKAKDIAKQHTFIMCPDSAKCLWHSDTRYHEPPYNAHPMDPTICRNAFDESCNPVDCVIH